MHGAAGSGAGVDDLLAAVAEQLKMPLTVISRQAELAQLRGAAAVLDADLLRAQADAALQLVDSYLLGLELLREQSQLELEPVSISSTLVDAAHALSGFARQHGVQIEVEVAGKFRPVMAHGRGLRAALLSLGYGLVEAHAASGNGKCPAIVRMATHRTPQGIIAGIYGGYDDVRAGEWRTALDLCGRATQPFTGLAAGSGAGLFVADTIFRSMATRLHVGRHGHERGLAAALQPSQQMQLV